MSSAREREGGRREGRKEGERERKGKKRRVVTENSNENIIFDLELA